MNAWFRSIACACLLWLPSLAAQAADAPAGEVRKLRAGTTLTPTGKRDGLFVEVEDSFGTKGWVSVEDMR